MLLLFSMFNYLSRVSWGCGGLVVLAFICFSSYIHGANFVNRSSIDLYRLVLYWLPSWYLTWIFIVVVLLGFITIKKLLVNLILFLYFPQGVFLVKNILDQSNLFPKKKSYFFAHLPRFLSYVWLTIISCWSSLLFIMVQTTKFLTS